MEITTLDHIIYGRSADASDDSLHVLGASGELNAEDAMLWQRLLPLVPPQNAHGGAEHAVGIVKGPEQNFILAGVAADSNHTTQSRYHFVLVPDAVFSRLHGDLYTLFTLVKDEATIPVPANGAPIPPLNLPYIRPPTREDRAALLGTLLTRSAYGGLRGLVTLLDLILTHSQLLIRGALSDSSERVMLIQGMMSLLPLPAHRALTFATHVADVNTTRARIVFDDTETETVRHVVDLHSLSSEEQTLRSPYAHYLLELWQGDLQTLLAVIDDMETDAARLMVGRSIQSGLQVVVQRHLLARLLENNENIQPDMLMELLNSDIPPADDVRLMAARRLLTHAFEQRDPVTARFVAAQIDIGDYVGRTLREQIVAALDTEPDAVYFFVRTHLGQAVDIEWLPVLQAAAVVSLKIAIHDEDDETVMSWLNLIAREPSSYGLQEVLYAGILEAEKRIFRGSDLGNDLLTFTARRAPHLIHELLDDDAFLEALQPPVGPAMRSFEPEAVVATIGLSREMVLVLMGHAARSLGQNGRAVAVFTEKQIDYLWTLLNHPGMEDLPHDLRPSQIISLLIEDGMDHLSTEATEALLTLIVKNAQTEFFRQISRQLARKDSLIPALISVFQKSGLSSDAIRPFLVLLTDHEILGRQQVVDATLQMVALREWRTDTLPLVEQITRLLQQNTELIVSTEQLWQMLALAEQTRTEVVTRLMTRRLLAHIETIDTDTELIEQLQHLQNLIQWNGNARTHFMQWWRSFVRMQSFVRLQRLDKALDGKRTMENARAVVQTSISVHRMLGKRTLSDFAAAISEAYNVLQALSESFDPAGKQALDFDAQTFRAELVAREADLSPDERSVLAKNLRELTQLITAMAENRSKSTLIRREEDIERNLLTGTQRPQSAIDTMKWLSGFLDGLQGRSSDDE